MDFYHLSRRKREFSTKFELVKIIQIIIKRLKTDSSGGNFVKGLFRGRNTAELSILHKKIKDFKNLRVLLLRKAIT